MISQQKNGRVVKKSHSAHQLRHSQSQIAMKYGPFLSKKEKIHQMLGYNLKKEPMGLKKHLRSETYNNLSDHKQSYFDLTLKVGGLNFFKRFKNIRYLENFSSKKNMYNVCEQATISNLHKQLANQKRKLVKSKKISEITF